MRSDAEIQHDVLDELSWDTCVKQTEVGVEVDGGIVTLTGTVDNYAKKLAAQQAAHRVGGVLDVANDIRVHIRNSLFSTDTEIAGTIRRILDWHAATPERCIRSSVSDGWVTLEGVVDSRRERLEIEHVISHIKGVNGVLDHMTISTPEMSSTG